VKFVVGKLCVMPLINKCQVVYSKLYSSS